MSKLQAPWFFLEQNFNSGRVWLQVVVVCFGNQSNLNFKRYIVFKLTAWPLLGPSLISGK
jgi:hypothetical protein